MASELQSEVTYYEEETTERGISAGVTSWGLLV
jgi:hypothetical protein